MLEILYLLLYLGVGSSIGVFGGFVIISVIDAMFENNQSELVDKP